MKSNVESNVVIVSKIVTRNSFMPNSPTAEDLCKGHKWRKSVSLPSDWVFCPNCHTEKQKDIK